MFFKTKLKFIFTFVGHDVGGDKCSSEKSLLNGILAICLVNLFALAYHTVTVYCLAVLNSLFAICRTITVYRS